MNVILLLLIALASYFLGGLNGAIIISQAVYRKDIRNFGSGGAGTTNMLRTFGWAGALMTVGIDVLKSVAAVFIGNWLFGYAGYPAVGRLFAGFCLMMGHIFPVLYQFKGGKGILCGAVVLVSVDWKAGLICIGIFAVIVAIFRIVSLGSIIGAAAFPFLIYFMPGHSNVEAMLALCCSLLAIFMHRGNIGRLVTGREPKISVGGKKPPAE